MASLHAPSCVVSSPLMPTHTGVSVPALMPMAPVITSRVPLLPSMPLGLCQRRLCQLNLVPSVPIGRAEVADEALVGAAESLQSLAVTAAEFHLVLGGADHLVCLPRVEAGVELEVSLAIRGDARQARLDGLLLAPTRADVTLHVPRSGEAVARGGGLEAGPLQPLYYLGEHGVLVEGWPGLEGLPALGTTPQPPPVLLVPAVPDAVHAVAVATGNGHRILQWIQADRTAEGVLVFQNSVCHVCRLLLPQCGSLQI